MKEAWRLYPSVRGKEAWPLFPSVPGKEAWPLYPSFWGTVWPLFSFSPRKGSFPILDILSIKTELFVYSITSFQIKYLTALNLYFTHHYMHCIILEAEIHKPTTRYMGLCSQNTPKRSKKKKKIHCYFTFKYITYTVNPVYNNNLILAPSKLIPTAFSQ